MTRFRWRCCISSASARTCPFGIVFWMFGAFILLLGGNDAHALSIWVLWHPDYAIEGVVKALTGIASIITFFITIKLIPQALKLASPKQLAALNAQLQENIRQRDHGAAGAAGFL